MKKTTLLMTLLAVMAFGTAGYSAVTTTAVNGYAAYLTPGGTWNMLGAGMPVAEGSLISTGMFSSVDLSLDGHEMTVEQLTTIKIYKNLFTGEESENSVGLKYGSVSAKINKIGAVKTRFNITTPVATSSVRGTRERIAFGPVRGMSALAREGVLRLHNNRGVSNRVSGRSFFNLTGSNPRPDPLLNEQRGNSLVKVHPDGITDEEQQTHQIYSDLIDNAETPVDVFDNLPSKVTVDLIWP
ncbi:MAG: hypothetical protein EPN93_04670 [Spirochaetes bacterium]|nr:MAG: hypothetical protein EPN93_04670 [Spirochaetota bacterium]